MRKFAVGCLLLTMMLSGCEKHGSRVVVDGTEDFRDGDLVMRCGFGLESKIVKMLSGSDYSHIGILRYDGERGEWTVVHAVPGEAPKGEKELVKVEPLAEYLARDKAGCGAWMRIECGDSTAARAAEYAMKKVEEGVEFDNDYKLSDTSRMYCTELVWQAYLHQGIDISGGGRNETMKPIDENNEYLYPKDIEISKLTLFVKPFKTLTK